MHGTVTDDQFVLDAILIQLPELSEKVLFIDEFLAQNANMLDLKSSAKIVLHESGTVQRLYPERKVCYWQAPSGRGACPART